MSYIFTKQCAGDLGILVLEEEREYMAAICFYRASGGYPVFDIVQGGEPVIFDSLDKALNHMLALAQDLDQKGIPS